jgi:hypothetical protein
MSTLVVLGGLISAVVAHGTVSGIVANGIFYEGYNPSYQYANPAPITVGWLVPDDLSNGFIEPQNYTEPDIICHLQATPAQIEAPIKAGQKVELQWTPWPVSHHGPVIDYLANCHGPCETVDKTTLKWFKIDQVGLINPGVTDGYWGTDVLIANNNSWTVEIPPSIATGNYVLRHEIIALHAANSLDGAQNYPQCVNLAITSTGTANPAGVLATTFYTPTDPGIYIDIYATLTNYTIPGPPLYTAAVTLTQTLPPAPTASASGIHSV